MAKSRKLHQPIGTPLARWYEEIEMKTYGMPKMAAIKLGISL
jgi:hypothetical protein